METEKIIFMDIDGVLLPKTSYLNQENQNIANQLSKLRGDRDITGFDLQSARNKLMVKLKLSEPAVNLLNTLAERSNAKIVIHSNWRRSLKSDILKQFFLDNGVKEKYLHEKPVCGVRLTSEKVHDILNWFSNNGDKKKQYRFVVIDDEHVLSSGEIKEGDKNYVKKEGIQITTSFDQGFDVSTYQQALGYLGGEDLMFAVGQLNPDEYKKVKSYFYNHEIMNHFLYTMGDHNDLRVNLISEKALMRSYESYQNFSLFLGGGRFKDFDDYYKEISKKVFDELERDFGKIKHSKEIAIDLKTLEKIAPSLDTSNFNLLPKEYPCIPIRDGKILATCVNLAANTCIPIREGKIKYIYAPKKFTEFDDKLLFLEGFLKGFKRKNKP